MLPVIHAAATEMSWVRRKCLIEKENSGKEKDHIAINNVTYTFKITHRDITQGRKMLQ